MWPVRQLGEGGADGSWHSSPGVVTDSPSQLYAVRRPSSWVWILPGCQRREELVIFQDDFWEFISAVHWFDTISNPLLHDLSEVVLIQLLMTKSKKKVVFRSKVVLIYE